MLPGHHNVWNFVPEWRSDNFEQNSSQTKIFWSQMYPKYFTKPYMPCNVKISFKKYLITDISSFLPIVPGWRNYSRWRGWPAWQFIEFSNLILIVFSNKTSSVVKIIIGAIVKLMINNILMMNLDNPNVTHICLLKTRKCVQFFSSSRDITVYQAIKTKRSLKCATICQQGWTSCLFTQTNLIIWRGAL